MPRLSAWILRTALIHLGVGITFGALMLFNKGVLIDPLLWRLLYPHIELVLLGWTMQLAMGTAFWIMPRHVGEPKYGNEQLGWWAYILFNTGVICLVLSPWLGASFALIGRASELLAALLFAIQIWPRVKAFGAQTKITTLEGNKS